LKKTDIEINIIDQILIAYLIAIVIFQVTLGIFTPIYMLAPLAIISLSSLFRQRSLGLVGFAGFELVAIPLIVLSTYTDIVNTLFLVIALVIPSVILLDRIMKLGVHASRKALTIKQQARPILFTSLILVLIIITVIILTFIPYFEVYMQGFATSEFQIVILAAVTIMGCAPFLEL